MGPPLVERYLRFACASTRNIASARLQQSGTLRAERHDAWTRFTATEHFTLDPIAFRWDAWVASGPLMRVRVRDGYERRAGSSGAWLFGVFPIGVQRASARLNEASLVRFLAESVWIPPMLRNSQIQWQELQTQKLRATLRDGATAVSVDFTFAESGEISQAETERYREVHGTLVLTPWRGYFEEYEPINGMMVPRSAHVQWITSDGPIDVWRGRIASAVFAYR